MGSESTAWLFEQLSWRQDSRRVGLLEGPGPARADQGLRKGSGNNFAFTSLNVPVDVQMAYVKELKPDLKNLTVLVDSKNISAVQTQAEPIAAYARTRHPGDLGAIQIRPRLANNWFRS